MELIIPGEDYNTN